jgi:PAS domain S-box-containing protein
MALMSPTPRRIVAMIIAASGVALAWVTAEPAGLLVAVAAVSICLGWQAGLAAIAVLGLAASPVLLAPAQAAANGPLELAAFLVAAFGVWLLIQIFRTVSFNQQVDESARQVIENLPGLGWSADPDGRIRFVNPESIAYVGMSADEARKLTHVGQLNRLSTHPDDFEASDARWRHSLRTGEPLQDEMRARRHDGTYRWFRDTAIAVRDENGRITGWYGTTTDIDDQKRAEEALRASEQRLRRLLDTVPALIWSANADGAISYINPPLMTWYGLAVGLEAAAKGQLDESINEAVHADDRAKFLAALTHSFATGEPFAIRVRQRRADGVYRWTDNKADPLRDQSGRIMQWYGVTLDIDDEIKAQEALRLSQERLARTSRAASLSELSVSIAHEINQPLGAVVANAHAFQRWLSAAPPNFDRAKGTAEKIIRNANAASEVISRIRALFTQTEQVRNPVDVNTVITEVSDLLADRLASDGVTLDTELDPNLPKVSADRLQIEQVVLNLLRNGIEAMQDVDREARILRILSRRQNGNGIEVEVHDRGPGVSDPDRIFEAFYTTKEDGLGMGLAICRSIIEAHAGRIWAVSAPGQGTSVVFSLPLQPPGAIRP